MTALGMEETDLLGHPVSVKPQKPRTRKGPARSPALREIKVVSEPALLTQSTERGPHTSYLIPDNEQFLGNLVDTFDAVPRFFDQKMVPDGHFDAMVRTCNGSIRDVSYQVTVTAATLQKVMKLKGEEGRISQTKTVGIFPGVREEFVEKAIRKISTHSSVQSAGRCVVSFTLYELKKELAEFGHDYKYTEIREALHILTHSRIQIVTADRDGATIDMTSGYLNSLDIRSPSKKSPYYRPEMAGTDQARCQVELHPLISLKISQGQFRLYQYGIDMSLASVYSRHLLRHLSLVWTNASEDVAFRLSLMDFIKNILAREPASRLHNDYRKLDEAVKELVAHRILKPSPEISAVKASKGNGYADYLFSFYPTNRFVSSVIQASTGAAKRRLVRPARLSSDA